MCSCSSCRCFLLFVVLLPASLGPQRCSWVTNSGDYTIYKGNQSAWRKGINSGGKEVCTRWARTAKGTYGSHEYILSETCSRSALARRCLLLSRCCILPCHTERLIEHARCTNGGMHQIPVAIVLTMGIRYMPVVEENSGNVGSLTLA